MPGIASTPQALEIRITFCPDGTHALWGRIDPSGTRGFEIYEARLTRKGWSTAKPVTFNSAYNDFDPFFARDGRSVLFFSNRPRGQGGDDIWSVSVDPRTGIYGRPVNLGRPVNTPRDEWAPSLSSDGGTLLFSSDGHGGLGGQDLFTSKKSATGWTRPANLGPGVNGAADDFDAAMVGKRILVFTSGDSKRGPVALFRADFSQGRFAGRRRLSLKFNCSAVFNLGPSWDPRHPTTLFVSSRCPAEGSGGSDILAIPFP